MPLRPLEPKAAEHSQASRKDSRILTANTMRDHGTSYTVSFCQVRTVRSKKFGNASAAPRLLYPRAVFGHTREFTLGKSLIRARFARDLSARCLPYDRISDCILVKNRSSAVSVTDPSLSLQGSAPTRRRIKCHRST